MLAVAILYGTASAPVEAADNFCLPAATQALLGQYPGLRVHTEGADVLAIYGVPMNSNNTAQGAVDAWLTDHRDALGVPNLDLRERPLRPSNLVGSGRFTVFDYDQYIDNAPVYGRFAHLLVLNGATYRVIYVGARLARLDSPNLLRAQTLTGAEALAIVQGMPEYENMTEWSEPELVIFAGLGQLRLPVPARAWMFRGSEPDPNFRALTFFVDAADGSLVHVRNDLYNADIQGSVDGYATPGTLPDLPSNPAMLMPLEDLEVRIQGGGSAFTDSVGEYIFANLPGSQVTLEADLIGRWATVVDHQGCNLPPEPQTATVTPPADVYFLFNGPSQPYCPSPEFTTAQVNTYIHVTGTHNFYKQRQPGFTGLDSSLRASVNDTSVSANCNAWFFGADPPYVLFNLAGGGCANTAYASVIPHEYGHFIVHQLGLEQDAFGEGFGDAITILLNDDPRVGRDFFQTIPPQTLRDYEGNAADRQYPCWRCAIHVGGQVLAGAWWDIKKEMQLSFGNQNGLELSRQMFMDWSQITTGGLPGSFDSAHQQTPIEALTVDDDDGVLANSTPHAREICTAFLKHNLECPGDCNGNGIQDDQDLASGTK